MAGLLTPKIHPLILRLHPSPRKPASPLPVSPSPTLPNIGKLAPSFAERSPNDKIMLLTNPTLSGFFVEVLMPVERRKFLQVAAAVPAAPTLLAQQPAPSPAAPSPADVQTLPTTTPDAASCTTIPGTFTEPQFAALQRLCDLIVPAATGKPGALDAKVPEFLDFLIGVSPVSRQQLYRQGLDLLNATSSERFAKLFAALDPSQADQILAPLRAPWTFDPPSDLLAHFLREAKADILTATETSRERADDAPPGSRRPRGIGLYWLPIDPLV
jgi:hypothetical protein